MIDDAGREGDSADLGSPPEVRWSRVRSTMQAERVTRQIWGALPLPVCFREPRVSGNRM